MPPLPEHLLAGYRNFMTGRYPAESGRYRSLARQGPSGVVLGPAPGLWPIFDIPS